MDKVLAAACALAALYLVICICYYLRLDRFVDKARFCLKNMSPAVDGWLDAAEKMVSLPGFSSQRAEFLILREEYDRYAGLKLIVKRPCVINQIHAVVSSAVPESAGDEDFAGYRHSMAVYAMNLDSLRLEYNRCAIALEQKRTLSFFGWIARLAKLPELTKLIDFEV